jgi:hypothetical protein
MRLQLIKGGMSVVLVENALQMWGVNDTIRIPDLVQLGVWRSICNCSFACHSSGRDSALFDHKPIWCALIPRALPSTGFRAAHIDLGLCHEPVGPVPTLGPVASDSRPK